MCMWVSVSVHNNNNNNNENSQRQLILYAINDIDSDFNFVRCCFEVRCRSYSIVVMVVACCLLPVGCWLLLVLHISLARSQFASVCTHHFFGYKSNLVSTAKPHSAQQRQGVHNSSQHHPNETLKLYFFFVCKILENLCFHFCSVRVFVKPKKKNKQNAEICCKPK